MQSEWNGIALTRTSSSYPSSLAKVVGFEGLGCEQLDVGVDHAPWRLAQVLGFEVGAERVE